MTYCVLSYKYKCCYIKIIDFNVNGVHFIQKCVNYGNIGKILN